MLSWLWQGLVVPLGVPEVNAWHAAGLVLVIGWLTHNDVNDAQPGRPWDLDRVMIGVITGLFSPLAVLCVAKLYLAFM